MMMTLTKSVLETLRERIDELAAEVARTAFSLPIESRGYAAVFLEAAAYCCQKPAFGLTSQRLLDFVHMSLDSGECQRLGFLQHPLLNLAAASTFESDGTRATSNRPMLEAVRALYNDMDPSSQDFDFLMGSAGIGAVALQYRHDDLVNDVHRRLKIQATTSNGRLGYLRSSRLKKSIHLRQTRLFDLGFAHGLLAPLLFFCANGESAEAEKLAATLLDALSARVKNQANQQNGWCYGDPVTGWALLKFGHRFPDSSRSSEAVVKAHELLYAGLSVNRAAELDQDLHFCHGIGGVIQIGRRASQLDSDLRLEPLLAELLSFATRPLTRWINRRNRAYSQVSPLLSGLIGAGLVVATCLAEDGEHPKIEWDRTLLFDF